MSKSLQDAPPRAARNLWVSKCRECSVICDFSDEKRDEQEKSAKTVLLRHLLAGFGFPHVAKSLTPVSYGALFDMVAANLCRDFPQLDFQEGLIEYVYDSAWVHLSLVYDCLAAAMQCGTLCEPPVSLSVGLVRNCISPDERERNAARQVLSTIYYKFPGHRNLTRQRCCLFLDARKCSRQLLEFFAVIASQLPLPLKQDSVNLFVGKILPLHSLGTYSEFSRILVSIISGFIMRKEELLQTTVTYLANHWPCADKRKEVMFIREYEELMGISGLDVPPKMVLNFYRKVSRLFTNESSTVARAAISVIQNKSLMGLLGANVSSLFFTVTLELNTAAKTHWDPEIREYASASLQIMKDFDGHSFAIAT
jgi:hypothetical protein